MARRIRRRPVPRRRRRRRQPQKGGLLPLMALGLAAGLAYQKRKKKKLLKERAPPSSINQHAATSYEKKTNKQELAQKMGTTTQRGRGLLEAALTGIESGKSKNYKRMGPSVREVIIARRGKGSNRGNFKNGTYFSSRGACFGHRDGHERPKRVSCTRGGYGRSTLSNKTV